MKEKRLIRKYIRQDDYTESDFIKYSSLFGGVLGLLHFIIFFPSTEIQQTWVGITSMFGDIALMMLVFGCIGYVIWSMNPDNYYVEFEE